MISINLLDYKRIAREVTIQKQLTASFTVFTLFLATYGLFWVVGLAQIGQLESDILEVEGQVAELTPEYNEVQKLKKRQAKLQKIISGIDELRSRRSRTTEVLEDVGDSLPEDIWLASIDQLTLKEVQDKKIPFVFLDQAPNGKTPPGKQAAPEESDQFFEIKGKGNSDQSIVNFIEQLRGVPYIDHVLLFSTKHNWIDLKPIREFTIYCHIMKPEPDKKA